MVNDKSSDSNGNIFDEKSRWVAKNSPLDKLNIEQKKQMLGAVPPPDALPVAANRELLNADQIFNFPTAKDWRNINGVNYITPVKAQGLCQSCVAFSITATVETVVRITQKKPDLDINLSEAHLFYCNGTNNPCQNGWWPTAGLDVAKNMGIAPESYFPYVAGNQVCAVSTGWESQKVQISGWRNLKSAAEIKNWLAEKSPVIACMEIFSDIHTYSNGIYHHLTGNSLGWHSLCVVGYNDLEKYWICKNCWGKEFGDNGFINIAYGECSIEQYGMFAVEGIVEARWVKSKKVLALWANDKENNAWAHIESEGWRKIYDANRLTFFQILMQLIQAKNKNTPVNVRILDNTIREIYS
jgi:C1A family cysteine protease